MVRPEVGVGDVADVKTGAGADPMAHDGIGDGDVGQCRRCRGTPALDRGMP
jgi:hypothetical protein